MEIPSDPAEIAALADAKRKHGDVLEAFDVVSRAEHDGIRSSELDYLLVFLLTELGDFDGALANYFKLGLNRSSDLKSRALEGRIRKDLAFLKAGDARRQGLADAAEVYRAAYLATGDPYPGINAASLLYLSGQEEKGQQIARAIAAHPASKAAANYWDLVTAVESQLLLGDEAAIDTLLEEHRPDASVALADRASTIRQFMRLREAPAISNALIDRIAKALRPPPVLVYCGRMFREGCDEEVALRARIDAKLDEIGACISYGPLACGADILIAEAVLERGGEINLVLPFLMEDFIEHSVLPGGASWISRFHACRARADEVILATECNYVGDDNQFAYGTRVAMGLAEIRARQLETTATQLAVLRDDAADLPRSQIAGTNADIAMWAALGRTTHVVPAGPVERNLEFPGIAAYAEGLERGAYSILFADYAGFSKLGERELPIFARKVMGPIGEVLDEFGEDILFRNTWGDALYAVISRPTVAARVALALQRRLAVPPPELGCAEDGVGMRIGVHHGPIYKGTDLVVGQPLWFGTEVTRTARIEPVTPTGTVYCTEAFAAMLALDGADEFTHHYVGRVALAKGYGQLAMYRLVRIRD
ncbi:MAG: TRAFs-binding domain-containing protein [Blastomonas sp.]